MNDDLEVLTDVDLEHFVETFESLFDRELTKVVDEPLFRKLKVSECCIRGAERERNKHQQRGG